MCVLGGHRAQPATGIERRELGHGGSSMRLERRYTQAGKSPFAGMAFRAAEFGNPQSRRVDRLSIEGRRCAGGVVAGRRRHAGAEVFPPRRRAGTPDQDGRARRAAMAVAVDARRGRRSPSLPRPSASAARRSARQVFHRMAGAWTYWGWKGGYFDSEDDARTFYDEHCYMLAAQICAPNSPQWFNTGLHWAYGIDGPGQGHWFVDHRDGDRLSLRVRLRAAAAACLLHPERRRRPGERRRHHGPVGA